MAVGVGMMGMTPSALYEMELREFNLAYAGWSRLQEHLMHQAWEVARWHGAITITPHIKSGGNIMQMLPLPWDEKQPNQDIDMEERRRRAAEMIKLIHHESKEVSKSDS